ncbi:MAG: hypothetical protein ACPG3T_04685 [Pseudomonadales bacterium]
MYNFIDVEASGFGAGSYPIEVGLAMASGQMHCTLIRPEDDWVHWNEDAEALHGIPRDILLVKGKSALKVAMLLNEWLDGQTVYSDAWGNDSCWLAMLYEEASIRQRFKIDSVVSLMSQQQMAQWHEKKNEVIENMQLQRHRASSDALILQTTLSELQSQQ